MKLFINILLAGFWVAGIMYLVFNIFDLIADIKKNKKSNEY